MSQPLEPLDFVFYYPHPENPVDTTVTVSYPRMRISHLWDDARRRERRYAGIGNGWYEFFMVRLSFLYTTAVFLISTLAAQLDF